MASYASATGLRCFMFSLAVVYAATPEEAEQFADRHGLWNRRPDGSWGRDASEAHAQLCLDQQAAYRALGGRRAREAQQARVGEWMTRSVPDSPQLPRP
jgi:hypothetical protein